MDEGGNKKLGKRRHESSSSSSSSTSSTSSTSYPQDGPRTRIRTLYRKKWDPIKDPEPGTSKAPDYGPDRPFVPPLAKRRKTEVQPQAQPQAQPQTQPASNPPVSVRRQYRRRQYNDVVYKCEICQKSFSRFWNKEKHIRTQVRK